MPTKPFPRGDIPTGNGRRVRARLNSEEAKLQGQAMLVPRVMESRTHKEISLMFGVGPQTVAKRLASAQAEALSALSREIISERMLPQALTLLELELQKGNYEAAKDVLYGMQVLQKGGKATIEHIASSSPTLDQIRKERMRAVDAEIIPPSELPSDGSS